MLSLFITPVYTLIKTTHLPTSSACISKYADTDKCAGNFDTRTLDGNTPIIIYLPLSSLRISSHSITFFICFSSNIIQAPKPSQYSRSRILLEKQCMFGPTLFLRGFQKTSARYASGVIDRVARSSFCYFEFWVEQMWPRDPSPILTPQLFQWSNPYRPLILG